MPISEAQSKSIAFRRSSIQYTKHALGTSNTSSVGRRLLTLKPRALVDAHLGIIKAEEGAAVTAVGSQEVLKMIIVPIGSESNRRDHTSKQMRTSTSSTCMSELRALSFRSNPWHVFGKVQAIPAPSPGRISCRPVGTYRSPR